MATFVAGAVIPERAREAAAMAVADTVGVALAGSIEPAARAVRDAISLSAEAPCSVLGVSGRASAADAALANGTAAHALDYDDMCFVSLAHPSAPLVSAGLAAAEPAIPSACRVRAASRPSARAAAAAAPTVPIEDVQCQPRW